MNSSVSSGGNDQLVQNRHRSSADLSTVSFASFPLVAAICASRPARSCVSARVNCGMPIAHATTAVTPTPARMRENLTFFHSRTSVHTPYAKVSAVKSSHMSGWRAAPQASTAPRSAQLRHLPFRTARSARPNANGPYIIQMNQPRCPAEKSVNV